MKCQACGLATATIELRHDRVKIACVCLECADKVMRDLAAKNVAGGGTIKESALGYLRWCEEVGRPCSPAKAFAVAKGAGPQ